MKKHNQTAKVLLSVCMGISMIFIMNITLTTHSVFTSQVNSTLLDPAELNGESKKREKDESKKRMTQYHHQEWISHHTRSGMK
jgi:hypothetical protein